MACVYLTVYLQLRTLMEGYSALKGTNIAAEGYKYSGLTIKMRGAPLYLQGSIREVISGESVPPSSGLSL